MPLSADNQKLVLDYCDNHLPATNWFLNEFSFIDDVPLRERLAQEFYAARYVYKLGEALSVTGDRLHAHVKFQIVQYASIYEAVIVSLLWGKFGDHAALTAIQFHEAFKLAGAFPRDFVVQNNDGEEIHLCAKRQEKTSPFSIKFNDKVDAAISIGFVEASIGTEVKEFYRLRNAIHLETAISKSIKYEIDQAQLAYLRMRPFIDYIKAKLPGLLPAVAPGNTGIQPDADNSTVASNGSPQSTMPDTA